MCDLPFYALSFVGIHNSLCLEIHENLLKMMLELDSCNAYLRMSKFSTAEVYLRKGNMCFMLQVKCSTNSVDWFCSFILIDIFQSFSLIKLQKMNPTTGTKDWVFLFQVGKSYIIDKFLTVNKTINNIKNSEV